MNRTIELNRKTKETDITLSLGLDGPRGSELDMGLPFFEHLLNAMAFHGGFNLKITARGDIEVDPHHLVEDIGLVLGDALTRLRSDKVLARFGHAVIPMDEALAEVTVDASGRPYLVYLAEYPQPRAGTFDVALIKEFLTALSVKGGLNLHACCRYGENSHHMVEALFKALGRALASAYAPGSDQVVLSTKGSLE
jgi:imidazoleglycerol-phosphate dehydratase